MTQPLLAVALLVLVAAPSVAGRQDPQPSASRQTARDRVAPATGSAAIRGRVFAADTRLPLGRARILLSGAAPPAGQRPPVVMTRPDGSYEFANLRPGRYHLIARRTGYLQMEFGARRGTGWAQGSARAAERGVTIDLSAGQEFDGGDFYLPRAAVIAGRIFDQYGDPVIGATVVASRRATAAGRQVPYAMDTTDDLGEYRLSGLPPASYYVLAAAPSPPDSVAEPRVSYADMFFPGVPSLDRASAVTVKSGQEAGNVDFGLSPVPLVTISGTISTSRGTVPRGASFELTTRSESGVARTTHFLTPISRRDGAFTLRSVPPGYYDLIATTSEGEVTSLPLLVTDMDISALSIVTASPGRVVGTVRTDSGAPLPGSAVASAGTTSMRVTATAVADGSDGRVDPTPGGAPESRPGTVTTSGSFVATVLPGPRLIGLAGLPDGWHVAAVLSGDRSIVDSSIDILPGATYPVQIVVSNRLAEISGAAVDQDGRRTWDYTVVVFPKAMPAVFGSPSVRSERPNQRGEFRIGGLRPDEYYVLAIENADDVDWAEPGVLDWMQRVATRVTLALGDRKTMRLNLVRMGT